MKSFVERCTQRWGARRNRKIRHATREEAQRHKQNLPARHRRNAHVYECPYCGGWHVGHAA